MLPAWAIEFTRFQQQSSRKNEVELSLQDMCQNASGDV